MQRWLPRQALAGSPVITSPAAAATVYVPWLPPHRAPHRAARPGAADSGTGSYLQPAPSPSPQEQQAPSCRYSYSLFFLSFSEEDLRGGRALFLSSAGSGAVLGVQLSQPSKDTRQLGRGSKGTNEPQASCSGVEGRGHGGSLGELDRRRVSLSARAECGDMCLKSVWACVCRGASLEASDTHGVSYMSCGGRGACANAPTCLGVRVWDALCLLVCRD